MLARALPKSVEQLNPEHACCDARRKELQDCYAKVKDKVLILDMAKTCLAGYTCSHCGTYHELEAVQEHGKDTFVGIKFVDIDEGI